MIDVISEDEFTTCKEDSDAKEISFGTYNSYNTYSEYQGKYYTKSMVWKEEDPTEFSTIWLVSDDIVVLHDAYKIDYVDDMIIFLRKHKLELL
jgi:hypothetical protein